MDNKEIRLIGRAVKEDWPIDADKRQEIIDDLMETSRSAEKDSDRNAARKILAAMVTHNRKVKKDAKLESDRNAILAILERQRSGGGNIGDGQGGPDGGLGVIEGSSRTVEPSGEEEEA